MDQEQGTQARILQCGKEEFLQKGFRNASLRRIAEAAGVTTGAIYGYYQDKQALFNALVEDPAEIFLSRFVSVQQEFAARPPERQADEMLDISGEAMNWMVDFIYANFAAFKLILCCSEGTGYASFIDRLVEIEVEYTYRFMEVLRGQGHPVRKLDADMIHIAASTLFAGMFEMVAHDMPKEKAVIYMADLKEFYSAGWLRLLRLG